MDLKAFDGQIAEEFQAVAALDQRDAFGRQALEFDRSHFRAVLLALTLVLRLLVVVEVAFDAIDGSPVFDLKPYMTEFAPRGEVRQPSWSRELMSGYW